MKEFAIITDSCSDLDKKLRTDYDVDYVPMHFSLNGVDYDASLDWETISVKDFYDAMRGGTRIYTAQVNSIQYKEKFESILNEGKDVLYIGCSSALSASVIASFGVKDELKAKYPDSKIICIDSLISCAGLGMLVCLASKLRKEGKSIEEVADYIENIKLNVHQEAVADKLVYLKQAGRVSATSAFFGGLLNVKPIIISDAKGQNFAVEKVKGRKNSIARLAERVVEQYTGEWLDEIVVAHADCESEAIELKNEIIARNSELESKINIGYIGPIVGASVGPGMMGVYFVGTKVTENA